MGLFHLANLFGMTIRESANDGSDFTNPDADYRRLFLGEDGLLHLKDSAGAVTTPHAGSGAVTASGLTMATARLLGRATAATGAIEEITLGTNLSFSGTTLNAAGGSASFAGVRAKSNADTVVAHNTWTPIALADTDTFDTGAYHDPASNNSRITATATGYFKVFATFSWRNSTNTAIRYGQIYKNGAGYGPTTGVSDGSGSDNDPSHVLVDIIPVVATDYIQIYAYQATGGNLNAYSAIIAVEFQA